MTPKAAHPIQSPAITRLLALVPLDDAALDALRLATQPPRRLRARYELLAAGQQIREAQLLLRGWAARVCDLRDGRRQILHLLLPGDLIGSCEHERPLAASSIIALTEVEVCAAPDAALSPTLREAYAQSRAHEQAHLLAQITRLGQMNAQERIADLALELLDRLSLAGLATNNSYAMPLTQETVADALGLTSVHVNRMLQVLRKDGELIWSGRELSLPNPERLQQSMGRPAVRVSASR